MKVAIIGTGYVGLPTGIGLAELGHHVTCIDQNETVIERLNAGNITLFEEGLEELFVKNKDKGRISFTTSMSTAIPDADVIIIAVGTPPDPLTQEADLNYIYTAVEELAQHLSGYTVIANKSTVPVGTGDEIEKRISLKNPSADFDIVSLPEFLREGFAVHDFFNPDRIIIGTNNDKAAQRIKELYAPFDGKTEFLFVSRRSSETIKYASNAFLAIKIHYINEIANFCEKSGADILEVAQGIGLDKRIGDKFLNPGPGYGGSCFPKDTHAMAHMGEKFGVSLNLINTAIKGNADRIKQMTDKITTSLSEVENPHIAVLGLAFKGGTDDCRASPAIAIVQELLNHKIEMTAYDPEATENAKQHLGSKITYAQDPYDALNQADAAVILTEWNEFRDLDLSRALQIMRGNKIIDLRNLLCPQKCAKAGIDYTCLGRPKNN